MSKERIIVIVGPTASGKTALGIKLAKKIGGEIISADSRMIYKGIPIGTASPNAQERRGVRHHCIGIANPKRIITADAYAALASDAIAEIRVRGKTPIVVGGSGFYIDALLYQNSLPSVPPNPPLRRTLEQKTAHELLTMLARIDPRRAREIDPHNKRRLVRALEIVRATGAPVERRSRIPRYDALVIGLSPAKDALERAIALRSARMVKNGLVQETKKLIRARVPKKRIRELGFEYRLPLDYIEQKISKQQLLELLNLETRRYAKRQMTWFKRDTRIRWFKDSQAAFRAFREAR